MPALNPVWKRRLMIGIPVLLIAIQLIPVDRSNPPVETEAPVPAELREVLVESCWDCHSNETTWPWYSYVAPVSWFVADHVHEGREELNFSAWNNYDEERALHKIEEMWEHVEEGDMPLKSYLILHGGARLTDEDRAAIQQWTSLMIGEGEANESGDQEDEHEDEDDDEHTDGSGL